MSKAPIIYKTKFYSPRINPDAKGSNAAHVSYIATRPGAETGDVKIGDNEINIDLDSPEAHVKYASERPGSHGLFDADGSVEDLKGIMDELKNYEGIVWRNIISLREDDAVRLGHITREKWEMSLRKMVPDISKVMGIPESNLRWVAAFHTKKGHPHSHLVIWERNPERTRGKIGKKERKEIKRIIVNELFAEERALLYAQKTALRDAIQDMVRNEMTNVVGFIKEIKIASLDVKELEGGAYNIPPRISEDTYSKMSALLNEISSMMPGKGRIAFAYMPEPVKQKVIEAADFVLKQPGFSKSLDEYLNNAKFLAKYYSKSDQKINDAKENAYEDIRNRICQVILKAAAEIQKSENNLKNGNVPESGISVNNENAPKQEISTKIEDTLKKTVEDRNVDEKMYISPVNVLRAAWRELDRERTKSEAKAEKIKMKLARESEEGKNKKSVWEIEIDSL